MILGRLIMRVLLVPLGAAIAICIATLVVIVAHWNQVSALTANDIDGLSTFFIAVPMLALSAGFMMLPAMITVLIAEAFAIRSWMYHAICGGLSAWVSVSAIGALDKVYEFYEDPLTAVAAGIAAGFAYWAVAGWSAGFWKPVFVRANETAPPPLPPK
jgi:hypothetical protein